MLIEQIKIHLCNKNAKKKKKKHWEADMKSAKF